MHVVNVIDGETKFLLGSIDSERLENKATMIINMVSHV